MATLSRNKEGSCPGRLNLVTSKDREIFLKAIHTDFIEKIDPLESGLMDELYACEVLTETDNESLQGNNVNTRRDKARKLLIILTEIPFNVFSSRVAPLLCSKYPHIIPQNFWANDDDMIASDDQQYGTDCLRCAIIKRIRPITLADLLYKASFLEFPTYKKIVSHGYNDEDLWAQIFQAFTIKPPDVSKHLSHEVASILQRYNFHCPENLHNIMSQGFPCECSKVDHVKPSSIEKVVGWLQMSTTDSITPPDMSSECESRNTSTAYPNLSEYSKGDIETESNSLPSDTTLHAELEASIDRGFETFCVSPSLIDFPAEDVLKDKHKLKASNKDQGQASQRSAENYWLQCIKAWYPELHTQTYFLPPLHFNRVPYSVENIAGEQVLVAQIPQDGPSQTPSASKSRSRKRQTTSSSAPNLSGPVGNSSQHNFHLQPAYDSDVRDDKALECVLYCLRALADNSQPKEVMMVISQLQFGKYLGEPSYAATAALLPCPSTLPKHLLQQLYHEGDFDVLIIHRQYGLFTLEIKSVGANFSQLKMTEQQEDDVVMKKVKEALKQLINSEAVLKHLTSDLADNNITKILAMPNISSTQLLRAISRNPSDGQGLCQCLGVRSVDDALKMCLLSNQLSGKRSASDVNHIVLKDLGVWWQEVVKMSGAQPPITETVYEHLVARFCGPATTVEVHCVTAPRLDIRILGEAMSATGETMARLVLFPQQVELLNRSPPGVFVIGPPGTGKTIVLIIQGLTWIRLGHDVHVVSTWSGSRAATIAIEHQLKETMKTTTASSRVHRHQFDFEKDGEVETAVRRLKSLSEGRQLCVIADEAFHYRKSFTEFCDQLIVQVPGVYLWGASVHHEVRPLCLEEVKLTTPLRSPPVVVREVMETRQIMIKRVHTVRFPVPTDGPAVIRITHRDGQSGHTVFWPRDCVECGLQVARVLTELNVGRTGNSNGPPPLQYRDVLVLCHGYLTDDRVDNNGQVTTTACGLVQGLRACHVPVRVVEKGDEAAIRDMTLGVSDLVTVTNWENVQGLERKVVVVEKFGNNWTQRLYSMSRCTSQLVVIDF